MINDNSLTTSRTTTLVLWLSCISLTSALAASTLCRNALYLAAFISLIDIFIKKTKPVFNSGITIVVFSLLLSVSLYLPTIVYPSGAMHDIDMNYQHAAERMFLGTIVAFYLISHRDKLSSLGIWGAKAWLIIGFIYTIIVAIRIHEPNSRLEIKTVATMTAYVFVVLSLVSTHILLQTTGWLRITLVISAIVASGYILLLTQTRSALLTWPAMLFLLLLKEKFFTRRSCIILLLISVPAFFVALPKFHQAAERISHSITEYKDYQNDDDSTSLGSRFSMWKAGLSIFSDNLLGESADKRDRLARHYINEYENGNREALRVIKYHYHNDLLEAATLRGVIGLFILLAFYVVTIVASRRYTGTYNVALLLMVPTLIYGSTDTLLIDHRYVTILILLIPFYLCTESGKITANRIISTHK